MNSSTATLANDTLALETTLIVVIVTGVLYFAIVAIIIVNCCHRYFFPKCYAE